MKFLNCLHKIDGISFYPKLGKKIRLRKRSKKNELLMEKLLYLLYIAIQKADRLIYWEVDPSRELRASIKYYHFTIKVLSNHQQVAWSWEWKKENFIKEDIKLLEESIGFSFEDRKKTY